MNNEKIKQEIIETIKDNGDCCSYIDEQEYMSEDDWQEIADAVQKNIIFDPCGLVYTADGFARYFRMKVCNKQ
ncbi:MAG: hypothetical protein J6S67_13565 [Methanobrevibacter sp.]|nr:hypothetical protein [Methanobrevibacter sp.]